MFGRILMPVDLSDRVNASLQPICELAKAHASGVTLFHVVEQIEDGNSPELESFYLELETLARSKLEGWGQKLSAQGVEVDLAIVRGKRVPEILRRASEGDYDLIALISHRVDAEHQAGAIGTMSHQVAMLAEQPVLLLR